MQKKNKLKPANRKRMMSLLVCLCLFMMAAAGILYSMQKSDKPVLQRKWQSEETGVCLTFHSDGVVTFDAPLPSDTYYIVSPDTMEYTINNRTFLMTYHIKDKKLYWGLNEETLECFKKCYY